MRGTRLIYLTGMLTFLLGCSDESELVNSSIYDQILQQQLIGGWSSGGGYKRYFKNDNTYVDSTWGLTLTGQGDLALFLVSTGRYSITNSILTFRDKRYTIFRDSTWPDPGFYDPNKQLEIQIEGDRLVCQPVDILAPGGLYSPDLYGVWSVVREISSGSYYGSVQYTRLLQRYAFTDQSDSCLIETHNLNGDSRPDGRELQQYAYSPPLLYLPASPVPNIRVEFKNGRMYWYYIHEAYSMTREQ